MRAVIDVDIRFGNAEALHIVRHMLQPPKTLDIGPSVDTFVGGHGELDCNDHGLIS